MDIKVTFFLTVLIIIQYTNKVNTKPSQDIEDAKNALESLKENIEKSENEIKEKHKTLLEQYEKQVTVMINDGEDQIKLKIQKLLKDLIQEELRVTGADITDCINMHKTYYADLEEKTTENLSNCKNERTQQIRNLTNETQALNDILDFYNNCNKEIEECTLIKNNQTCAIQLLKQISEEAEKLPAIIDGDIKKFKETVEAAKQEIKACISDRISRTQVEGANITTAYEECVRNKYIVKAESRSGLVEGMKALKGFKENLFHLSIKLKTDLQKIEHEFQDKAKESVKKFKQQFQNKMNENQKEIDKAKAQAEIADADIYSCIDKYEGKENILQEKLNKGLEECLTLKTNTVTSIIKKERAKMDKYNDEPKKLQDALENCNGEACLNDVFIDIVETNKYLLKYMRNKVSVAKGIIKSLEDDLDTCANDKSKQIDEEDSINFGAAKLCFKEEINMKETNNNIHWEDSIKILNDIKKNIQNAIEKSNEKLQECLNEFKIEADNDLQGAKKTTKEEIIVGLRVIRNRQKATNETDCPCYKDEELRTLEEKPLKDFEDCVSSKLQAASEIMEKSLAQIGNVMKECEMLEEQLEQCKGDDVNLKCVEEVLKAASRKSLIMMKYIKTTTEKAEDIMESIKDYLDDCFLEKHNDALDEVNKVVNKFKICIQN